MPIEPLLVDLKVRSQKKIRRQDLDGETYVRALQRALGLRGLWFRACTFRALRS